MKIGLRSLVLVLLLLLAACGSDTVAPTAVDTSAQQPTATAAPPPPTAAAAPTSAPQSTEAAPTTKPTEQAEQPSGTGTIYIMRQKVFTSYKVANGAPQELWDFNQRRPVPGSIETEPYFWISPDGQSLILRHSGSLIHLDTKGQFKGDVPSRGMGYMAGIGQVAWAPDSSALAYVPTKGGDELLPSGCTINSEVYVYVLGAEEVQLIGQGCNPTWDANSQRIAYVTASGLTIESNELRLSSAAGEELGVPLRAPVESDNFPQPRASLFAPFWSPEGSQLYVLSLFSQFGETNWYTIEQVDATNGGSTPLGVIRDLHDRQLDLSPDGTMLAYVSAGAKGTTAGNIVRLNGTPHEWEFGDIFEGSATISTEDGPSAEYVEAVDWSPDGTQLAVLYCRPADSGSCGPDDLRELRLMDIETGALSEPLMHNIDPGSSLDWVP